MNTFSRALAVTSHKASDWSRLQHCLNYLREAALCQADMTLETGDFTHKKLHD
ncbi:hypothetical protein C8R47DRAFT_1153654 [Mycena vitilis]|nr:hypothetical protein C8R47DRAFT_1153654 [Mycena vitilis]